MTDMVSVAFTGGGTGGHIYPGLAVAAWLGKLMPCRIFWIGSGAGMDRSIVEEAGIEFFGIPAGKLRRYFSLKNVSDVFRIGAGFVAARKILSREKPAVLFSKGGFVSVPPCAAAASLKIPVFAHESDLSPGLATRLNIRFTGKLFIPYLKTADFFPPGAREKLEVSGNPVRPEFFSADPAKGRAFLGLSAGERVLLVLGGSQGSREINSLVQGALKRLTSRYTVVHQTGENEGAFAPAERYKPYPYFRDELPHVIAAAELVICRGGAGTLWECASLRKPMVIIPLRGSGTRGDQVENAGIFEESGAAVSIADDPSPEKLSELVDSLAADEGRRKAMSLAGIGRTDAARHIAEAIARKAGGV
ncbi:MAG: undecaprenyldiphospho-muramoylpentapeptide beta-N-acetylglucosaminyltransferase [Treponema sp.]|jgi:UDP-N-acetylglucosamine--N-acetylmuramyl-(pentapeptide) pyrophosphoryl-undecaprenol N-acetylglucosamine transferase|nr:undecaprenyldiphospho-muramoylpentapeptide beta-N-acetylglucosaminyltransferase [Treponema sp.]